MSGEKERARRRRALSFFAETTSSCYNQQQRKLLGTIVLKYDTNQSRAVA
jgi:hypothetical protein